MLSEDQLAFRDTARAFAAERMAPFAARWDAEAVFPAETLREAAALGFGGITIAEDVGGAGLGRLDAAVVFEELARACPSTAAFLSIHTMASSMVDRFGHDDLRRRHLPDLASARRFASYCLTEPGAGSDAGSLRTRARKDGNHWVLDGTKAFISGGGVSDVYVVMARTGADGPRGISCFVVEKDTPGLSFGKQEEKLGWKSQPTAAVLLENCRVPAENLVGEEGQGFRIAMAGLDGGRLNVAACSLGGAAAALDHAVGYIKERRQFGKALADMQALRFKVADMATALEASRLLVHRAAALLDGGDPGATAAAAMAKRFATDSCFGIVDDALQLHGGYGYLRDFPIERIFRDLRVHRILEGTNEIMRVIVARDVLGA